MKSACLRDERLPSIGCKVSFYRMKNSLGVLLWDVVTANIVQTRKGYWLSGLSSLLKYGSGFGYAPSVYHETWHKSKESAIAAVKKEAEKWLAKELAVIPVNEKLQHRQGIQNAIEELNSVKIIQMDLL